MTPLQTQLAGAEADECLGFKAMRFAVRRLGASRPVLPSLATAGLLAVSLWVVSSIVVGSAGFADTAPASGALGVREHGSQETQASQAAIEVSLLRGGLFELVPPQGMRAPAWWRTLDSQRLGGWQLVREDAETWLVLEPGTALVQNLPWPPGVPADGLVFRGKAEGAARASWSGFGGTGFNGDLQGAFELTGQQLVGESGGEPRFALTLYCPEDAARPARFAGLSVTGRLPQVSAADLKQELVAELEAYFAAALTYGTDDLGEVPTPFLVRDFDLASGQPRGAPRARVTLHPLYSEMLRAHRAAPRESWEQALIAFVDAFLTAGIEPESGLPRFYDPLSDRPRSGDPLEIRAHLAFLLDVVEFGPEAVRERALEAARRIAERVLQMGLLPDGTIAAQYVPDRAVALTNTPPIRRLDVPASLARLGRLTSDSDLRDVARDAVLEMEYAHWWPGTWDAIDPGFDDDYGHYGQRAATMLKAWPDVPAFERLSVGGLEHYLPLWRDAVRYGGNVAADQVRCWEIAAKLARLVPELREPVAQRIDEALHLHLVGEQIPQGRWIDVTVVDFQPQHLPVGDTAGAPQNLMFGLGMALDPEALGQGGPLLRDPDECRAWFAALWRAEGRLGAGEPGSFEARLRLLPGTVRALEGLSRSLQAPRAGSGGG